MRDKKAKFRDMDRYSNTRELGEEKYICRDFRKSWRKFVEDDDDLVDEQISDQYNADEAQDEQQ
jgi:hypothetical protein